MNIHKSIVCLLLALTSFVSLSGQDCVSFVGPTDVFMDEVDTTFVFPVYNADSTILGSNQEICKVNISFDATHVQELIITLISPSGEEIILVGPVIGTSTGSTAATTWDIAFVPLDSVPRPDPGFSPTWDNNQDWTAGLGIIDFTGTYHPFNGSDLANLRLGNVYGDWKLRFEDRLFNAGVQNILNSFSIEFCNPSGLDCTDCLAEADTITPTTIEFCQNDLDRSFEFSDYLMDTTFIDSLEMGFTYRAVVVENDTVIDFLNTNPLSTTDPKMNVGYLSSGNYHIYGMSFSDDYAMDVPVVDSSFTVDSLRSMMDSLPRIFCGDLTDDFLTLIIEPVDTTEIVEVLCAGDSLVIDGVAYKDTDQFQVVLTNQYGCDSIIDVDLTIRINEPNPIEIAICSGDSLEVGGVWYSETINDLVRLKTDADCDSLIILDLTVRPYNFRQIKQEICGDATYSFFGNDLNMTGIYRDSSLDVHGCDSVVVLDLTVVTQFDIDTTAVLCEGDSFLLGTAVLRESGVYVDTLISSLGCDSIINLDLTIVEPERRDFQRTICFGDSTEIGGVYYSSSGAYTDTLISSIGCDSIVRLALTVRPQNGSLTEETICFGDSLESAGNYYSTTGIHIDTLTDILDCDSIVTLDLTIRPENRMMISDEICFGDSVVVGDSIYRTSGVFETVLLGQNMCDSIVELDLIVLDQVLGTLDAAICAGDSILINGQYYSSQGNFTTVYQRFGQCDSTLSFNLQIIQPIINDIAERLCEGFPYVVGSSTYNAEGIYRDTFTSSMTGCDSIVVLDLKYDSVYVDVLPESICAGDSILFDDIWIKDSGVYDDTLQAVLTGCDSIQRLELAVLSLDDPILLDEELCFGDSLLFDGVYLRDPGIFRDTLLSSKDCDSLVVLDLKFRQEIRVVVEEEICLGESYPFQDVEFTETGMYPFTLTAADGCDSTVVLDLTVTVCPIELTIIEEIAPTCGGIDNGLIRFSVNFGVAPYDANLLLDGMTIDGQTGPLFTGLTANSETAFRDLGPGRYSLIVGSGDLMDPNNENRSVYDFVLTPMDEIEISNVVVSNYNGFGISCPNSSDGAISFEADGGTSPYSYTWSDEVIADSSRSGMSAGPYEVYVNDANGCRDTFAFELTEPEPITFDLVTRDPSCADLIDGAITFTNVAGGTGQYQYSIDIERQATPVFSNLGGDTYALTVADNNGCMADDVRTLTSPPIFSVNLGEDISLENTGDLDLFATFNGTLSSITWSPPDGLSCADCIDPTATISRTITYKVEVTNDTGCEASDQITIILDIDRTIDPASAFTPNGDEVNDTFIVHGNSSIAEVSNIEIYSRSGELVFSQKNFPVNDENFGWDGTFKGEPLTTQVLGYFMEILYKDGKSKIFKGEITLIR